MATIPVKINRPAGRQEPPANLLNLTDSPVKTGPKKRGRKFIWLLLFLLLAEGAAIAWLYLAKPVSPYSKFFPEKNAAVVYFNQEELLELTGALQNKNSLWLQLKNNFQNAIAQTRLDQPKQLLELFDSQMALALLAAPSGQSADWLMLASLKTPLDIFSRAREETENSLKQNFNIIHEAYRQIDITQIKPLEQGEDSFFYAQTGGYLFIADNDLVLKTALDKAIGR